MLVLLLAAACESGAADVVGGDTSGDGEVTGTWIADPTTTTGGSEPEPEPDPEPASSSSSSTSASGDSTGHESSVWRSSLYPITWTPGVRDASDRGFADFSYAGYRHGESPPSPPWPTLNLVDFGADPRGTGPSDAAFADALAAAPLSGAILEFPAGRYRFEDRIVVTRSNLLVRDAGPNNTFLHFTQTEGMDYGGHIEFAASLTTTGETLLSADAPRDATTVELADSSFFVPGDDVLVGWTLTDAFIASYGMEEPRAPARTSGNRSSAALSSRSTLTVSSSMSPCATPPAFVTARPCAESKVTSARSVSKASRSPTRSIRTPRGRTPKLRRSSYAT